MVRCFRLDGLAKSFGRLEDSRPSDDSVRSENLFIATVTPGPTGSDVKLQKSVYDEL